MKTGVSSYSLGRLIGSGQMTFEGAVDWSVEHKAQHLEIVESDKLDVTEEGLTKLRKYAESKGIEISSYTFGADFSKADEKELRDEIDRVKVQIDRAGLLGTTRVRHDVAGGPSDHTATAYFEKILPQLAASCREIADHAKQYGITTSMENHGYFMQASERVRHLILATDRENFRTTIDVGNFLCVDEDPVSAVRLNLPFASHIHMKDFHVKQFDANPGDGWFRSASGRYLRGAIFGHGDVDVQSVMKLIVQSDFDGCLSLEFEGMEDADTGCRVGLANIQRLYAEAKAAQA